MTAATHPPADTLAAFGRGELPPDDLAAVADHVAACAGCCAALRDVRDDSLVGLLRDLGTPADPGAGDRTNATPPGSTPSILAFRDARSVLADHPQYRLLDQLGEGGMGVVFRAEHKVMGRVVALKVMAPHLTEKPSAVARFRLEVRAAAKLNHPNIVTAYDAGEAGGLHFLVMEYVEGVSLDKLVAKKGPLPIAQAAQFIRQAAQGLQHAHQAGMVHRDIKPQNLIVTRKGHVKVLDFGLARFARDAVESPAPGSSESMAHPPTAVTGMNTIMGTPDYLSPEQARCAAVDIRADVYSLGCTLYFLLTGRAPFEAAGSAFDKILAHATEAQPPLAATRLDVPGGLELVLAKMTAKDPAARFATPAEVAAALAPYARGEGAGAQPVVEAAFAPAPPAVTPAPAVVPAFVPEPPPTEVIVTARPRRDKKRKKGAAATWTPARWAALGGVLVAVLIGGLVVRGALKKPVTQTAATTPAADPPRVAAAAPTAKTVAATVAATKVTEPPAANPWRNGPPQVLFVLPVKGLYPPDYGPVRERLESHGVGVKVAVGPLPPFAQGAFEPGFSYPKKDGNYGSPVRADFTFYPDFDLTPVRALVFVGEDVGEFVGPPGKGPGFGEKSFGKGPPTAQTTGEVLRRARERNVVIGGICTGQLVLAKHGVLDGKTVARSQYSVRDAGKWGVSYPSSQFTLDSAPVRTDGRVVTAAGPEHAAAFADALVAALREP